MSGNEPNDLLKSKKKPQNKLPPLKLPEIRGVSKPPQNSPRVDGRWFENYIDTVNENIPYFKL